MPCIARVYVCDRNVIGKHVPLARVCVRALQIPRHAGTAIADVLLYAHHNQKQFSVRCTLNRYLCFI